jgi:hypothetical protein
VKTKLSLRFCAVAERRSEALLLLKTAGDVVLIERGIPRSLLIVCPCGCGEICTINLDARVGWAWRIKQDPPGRLSLYPSVWRTSGCQSHYVIRDGEIVMIHNETGWNFESLWYGKRFVMAIERIRQSALKCVHFSRRFLAHASRWFH